MKTALATPPENSFEVWKVNAYEKAKASDLRFGQALFNSAPAHIQVAAGGVMDLDPFYVGQPEQMYIINNFLLFALLCWDVEDPDELMLAIKLVMSEPNARR